MNPTTSAILKILQENSGFTSGAHICSQLEISRTAVWKHIKTLEKLGYQVEAISKRGYRLIHNTERPIPEALNALLHTTDFATGIEFFEEISSTNRLLLDLAKSGIPGGLTVIADHQSAGHGRMQRSWFSPANCNLYFSNLIRPNIAPYKAPQLALLSAVAIYDALKKLFPELPVGIKWPNDIFIAGKKCAGILCEMQTDMTTVQHVVIGIGLNVNVAQFPDELKEHATSIRLHTGRKESRNTILAEILNQLDKLYKTWLKDGLKPFIDRLNNASILKDKPIVVELANGELEGVVKGINEDGTLLVQKPDHTVHKIPSGEVHIKKFK
jgi:BirA family biotin operon repressor/biotin-[acetyl-CoA-carboxylase] ligase